MVVSFNHGLALRELFGRNVRRLRKARGLSQEALSMESGLAQNYLSDIETGKRNVSLENIGTLARALGIPIAALFDE